ncbi:MAG: response regulator [Salinivirgaceae bacterium]|nr:response regulator [Salinivirgaceae bacterium]MDD4748235.1 response regulator [Salinivirgaceae bacterium]MDY0280827.1 response regulator [Salinivirgaceae bacterium]
MNQNPWENVNWKGKRILIAEDEEVNMMFFQEVLEDTGVEIIKATDGLQAVDLFTNNKVDLVLMDIKMPVMNGLDATQKIKQLNASIPIVAQTAYAMEDEKQRCFDAGCDDYISKPIDTIRLFAILKKYLR